MSWWHRFKPKKGIFSALLLSTVMTGVTMLWVWLPNSNAEQHMSAYGKGLARTLAQTSAGHLLHRDRIELAVIANQVVVLEEVAGVLFYNTQNEIVAVNGSSDQGTHFTASATLDDTITGYVSVVLNQSQFVHRPAVWQWLVSGAIFLLVPLLSLMLLQLTNRGNRSLPIVSVPDLASPQQSYCVALNLHNQMSLDREQKTQAIADAMEMALEACATYQGLRVEVPGRGVLLLFDIEHTTALQTLSVAFLLMRLLAHFETQGDFRAYVSQVTCPGSPAERPNLEVAELDTQEVDTYLTLAALAKPSTLLVDGRVYQQIDQHDMHLGTAFNHPLVQDLTQAQVYNLTTLDSDSNQWIEDQANLILGFTRATAS